MIGRGESGSLTKGTDIDLLRNPDTLFLRTRMLLFVLLAAELAMAFAYVTISILEPPETVRRVFSLDGEQNVGSWFSAIQLFAIGLVLITISLLAKGDRWPKNWLFFGAGLAFMFLSADEALAIHESITGFANRHAKWLVLFPGNHGAWIPLYLLSGIAALGLTWRSILLMLQVHRKQTAQGIVGGILVLIGALGVEVAGYFELFASPVAQVTIEELFEMFGASLILISCVELLLKLVRVVPLNQPAR